MSAAWESLHLAVRELAAASCIKQRLTSAFSNHLSHLEAADLPPDARPRFRDLQTRLTAVPPMRGESAICATVRKMSNEEAAACARSIVDLFGALKPDAGVAAAMNGKRARPALPLPRLIAEA